MVLKLRWFIEAFLTETVMRTNKQTNKHVVTFLFLNFSSFFVPREYCLEVKSVHK